MIETITRYEEIGIAQWDALLQSSPVASWFQSRECYDFFNLTDGHEPFVVAVKNAGTLRGLIAGVIMSSRGIGSVVTRRAIINGGPLLSADITEEELQTLLDILRKSVGKRAIYTETRNLNDYSRWRTVFEACNFRYIPHYNFHIDTSDPEAIMKRLSGNRRREIKKALEYGAYIDEDPASITDFYAILNNLYKTKVKTPLPSIDFFRRIANLPSGHIFIVYDAQKHVIGGQVCVFLSGKVGYDWYCCGLDHEYKSLHPSGLASFAGIKYASENGYPLFDMMGAGAPGDGGYGVRNFKAQFGGQLVEHGRFLFINNPIVYNTAKWLVQIRKKL